MWYHLRQYLLMGSRQVHTEIGCVPMIKEFALLSHNALMVNIFHILGRDQLTRLGSCVELISRQDFDGLEGSLLEMATLGIRGLVKESVDGSLIIQRFLRSHLIQKFRFFMKGLVLNLIVQYIFVNLLALLVKLLFDGRVLRCSLLAGDLLLGLSLQQLGCLVRHALAPSLANVSSLFVMLIQIQSVLGPENLLQHSLLRIFEHLKTPCFHMH